MGKWETQATKKKNKKSHSSLLNAQIFQHEWKFLEQIMTEKKHKIKHKIQHIINKRMKFSSFFIISVRRETETLLIKKLCCSYSVKNCSKGPITL